MAPKPPKPKPKAKPKASLDVRIRTDAALRKRVLANPGLRSKLSTSTLQKYRPAAAKTRTLNARLNAPITPGSSTTERDLAHEARAAQTVRYQPQETAIRQQLGVAQQVERDTGSFYDQYRQALQDHAARVQAFQAGAQQAQQQLQAGITGLGQDQAAQMQQQANAQAAQQGVAPAGDLTQLANQALSQRQQFAGTFGAQQAQTGAAANTYADTLANVVAPTQKLSALAQARGRTGDVRQKQADLRAEEAAFNEQFRSQRRQDEFKNVLAMKTLGVTAARTQAQIDADNARAAANTPEAQATKTSLTTTARVEATNAGKLGLSVHQYRLLGPDERKRRLDALKAKSGSTAAQHRIRSGPFAGLLPSQVDQMTPDQIQKRIDAKKPKGTETTDKKAFRDKYGVDLQATSQHNTARDKVQNAQTAFGQVGKVVKQPNGKPHRVTTDDVVTTLRDQGVSNLWIRAGLEMARGGLTPGTAARIHKAGYSISQLGFKMRPAGSRPSTTTRPGSGPATARQ